MPLPVWRRKITIRVKEDSIEEIVIFRMYLKENLIMKYIYIYIHIQIIQLVGSWNHDPFVIPWIFLKFNEFLYVRSSMLMHLDG